MTDPDISKKEVIKKAARTLFFQFGLSKTSMDDIAQQCGSAKPTLYYYYPSKEAIFNEIVIDEANRFINKVEQKIPPELPADEKIAFFFQVMYEDLKLYSRELSHIPELLYNNYPHGRPIIEKINAILTDKLRPLLREGKEKGIFDFTDEDIMLSALTIMTNFLNLNWMRQSPEHHRDQITAQVINIILDGIRRN